MLCINLSEYWRSVPGGRVLSVSTKNNDFWPGPTSEIPSLCACLESSLINLIGSGLNLLFTKPFWTGISLDLSPRTYPETVILGANQKAGNLWGQECLDPRALPSCAWQTDTHGQEGEGSGVENCWYFFTADLPGTPKCIKFGPTGISQFPSVEGGKII